MDWQTIEDSKIVFWSPGAFDVQPGHQVDSLDSIEQTKVELALELLYNGSPSFKQMIDGWIASGGTGG